MKYDRKRIKQKRNDRIRKDFVQMLRKHYRYDYILEILSEKYGLSPITIWAIIKRYGYYKE